LLVCVLEMLVGALEMLVRKLETLAGTLELLVRALELPVRELELLERRIECDSDARDCTDRPLASTQSFSSRRVSCRGCADGGEASSENCEYADGDDE
jgi:hypothetical protein